MRPAGVGMRSALAGQPDAGLTKGLREHNKKRRRNRRFLRR
ncbi:hypothetical protein Y024_5771 [Burkholderia pseudomallei TSV44]|nr:hypothetical protein Y024_5771 [Burkholderia pseudomallei TSV44]